MKTQTEMLYEAYYDVYLSEEEKQLELLKKTKSGYEPRSMTPSATRKQKGVPVEGGKKEKEETPVKQKQSPGQLSLDLKKKKTYGEKIGRVLTTLDKIAKAKFERGLGKRKTSDEALRRFTRRELAKEDYFDIVADYLLENFEFESEQHLYKTMASLDEELIDEILEGLI